MDSKITEENYNQWLIDREKDDIINPFTKRKIVKGKKIYNDIDHAFNTWLVNKNTDNKDKNKNLKSDKFLFYSGSKDTKPGEFVSGRKEQEYVNNINDYTELSQIKDWRKILSNFHVHPFKYTTSYGQEVTYNSIEHGFQAEKIALINKEKAFLFTLESNSELGKGNGFMAQQNRKMIILSDDILEKWSKINSNIMENLAISKYEQCREASYILKLTKDAELWHIISRKGITRFSHLERIRNNLLK
jgi:hypothetical protein